VCLNDLQCRDIEQVLTKIAMFDVEVQSLLTPHIDLVTLIDRGYFPAVSPTQMRSRTK